jgi:hypothetical protein
MSGSWYYAWSKVRLKNDSEIPDFPHYAVLVFTDQRYTTRGYDRDDPDETHTARVCSYYAFAEGDKKEWEKMISDIHKEKMTSKFSSGDNENFVFFHSSGKAKVTVKIDVNVAVDDDDSNPMHGFGHGRGD